MPEARAEFFKEFVQIPSQEFRLRREDFVQEEAA